MAVMEFRFGDGRPERVMSGMFVSIRALLLRLLRCDYSRDIVQCKRILMSEEEVVPGFSISSALLNDVRWEISCVHNIIACRSFPNTSTFRSIHDSRSPSLLDCL
jgi:hypothetical protein